ncbi:MAG: hypothetical protein ACREIF_02200 [Chthoniobacterales bacterium]
MNTYFIRHTADMDIDDQTRRYLWDERKIAIHFPHDDSGNREKDSRELAPERYSGSARKAMRALTALADSGGYVCGRYFPPYEDCLVGFVEPNSQIELVEGRWGKKWGLEGRVAVLKTLPLTRTKIVKPTDCAVIMVGRPRQGTIMKWTSAVKTIENIVEGRRSAPAVIDLFVAQQEIMCSEVMRLPAAVEVGLPSLACLLLPVGRTMKDIDIAGLTAAGRKILAQVTYAPLANCQAKLDRLVAHKDPATTDLVFFCDCDSVETREGALIFPIQKAFDMFSSSTLGKEWLRFAA